MTIKLKPFMMMILMVYVLMTYGVVLARARDVFGDVGMVLMAAGAVLMVFCGFKAGLIELEDA